MNFKKHNNIACTYMRRTFFALHTHNHVDQYTTMLHYI